MKPKTTTGRWFYFLVAALCVASHGAGAQETNLEYQVKAAFLFQFPSYIDWPESTFADEDSPLTFGVIGSTRVYEQLLQLSASGRLVKGRATQVQALTEPLSLTGVHVLFIGDDAEVDGNILFAQAVSTPALVVTDSETLQPDSSMINLIVVDNRVKFEVALTTATRSGLRLSSQLLRVAQNVVESP